MIEIDAWREKLIKIEPYVPGEQLKVPGLIKLNTNENPFPPSPGVIDAIRNFDSDGLSLYPDISGRKLRKAIAARYGVECENVFVGNGSDEVLGFAFKAFFAGDLPIIFPDITYSFYPVWCRFFGIPYETAALDDGFSIPENAFDGENGGIVICNPNAPTAIDEGVDFVERVLMANRNSIVIVDEAYVDFGAQTALPLLKQYDNLAICRSLSKSYSLAGMRIGFCLGSAELIAALDAVKNSFNSYTMSNLAVEAGVAAFADDGYYQANLERIGRTRERVTADLRRLGFDVIESKANFLFATHRDAFAKEIYLYLKERNILVRYFDKPRIDNHLRISVGADADMDALLASLEAFLAQ
jgi:histidinol-phosphate aminotransferase